MDMQTRKLNVIEFLIKLQDEQAFQKIEKLILENREPATHKPKLTAEQLISRAEEADSDYKAGRFLSQDDLEKKAENW